MFVNKNHPALKHGGHSTTTILPTESVAEFEELHKDLISELEPNGALADDIVATITRMVWRKRNLLTFGKAKVVRVEYIMVMRREFSRMLPEQTPPPEFQGDVYSEADAEKFKVIDVVARKELGDDAYMLASETATVDGLMNELEIGERLNAAIERGVKRLLFVKGLESILAPSSSSLSKRLGGSPRAPASAKRSMPVRVKKIHPALKHGGYAATVLLPGESIDEFEKLRRDLIANFTADGALEGDIVEDLAGRLWRKQNRATFRAAEVARQHYNAIVSREFDKLRASDLTEEEEDEEKFVLEWYGITEEKEIRRKAMLAEREKAIRAADDIARNELGDLYELAKMADTVTVACLMEDLAVEERLDAAIDKCLKRLLSVKGLKSISASSSSAPPNRITGPSEAA
jgi:hypothetical protein